MSSGSINFLLTTTYKAFMKTKKAWLAALLNFFFVGVGYFYNGKRIALGLGLILAGSGLVLLILSFYSVGHSFNGTLYLFLLIGNVLLGIDAYEETKGMNSNSSVSTSSGKEDGQF